MESKEEKAEAMNLERIASLTRKSVAGRKTMGNCGVRGNEAARQARLPISRRWAIQNRKRNRETQGHTRCPSYGHKICVPANNKTHGYNIVILNKKLLTGGGRPQKGRGKRRMCWR
jgi:Rad3-related DNA helicase